MSYDDKKFRELLIKAIGTETKQRFAEKAHIKPQQLSRYLRDDYKARPSQRTLKKIADAAGDSQLYDELLEVCGYGETPSMRRRSMPYDERAALNAQDLSTGLKELTAGTVSYPSIEALIKVYEPIYSLEKLTEISVFRKKEYEGRRNLHAEYIACARVKYEDALSECITWFAVYFAETKGGNVVVFDVAMDPASVLEAGGISREVYEEMKDKDFVYQIKTNSALQKKLDNGTDLFEAIFGGIGEEYVYTYLGFGFYLDEMQGFREFILNHEEGFCTGEKERALYDRLKAGEPYEEVFSEYEDDAYTSYIGPEAAIAKIMREETDLKFTSCIHGDEGIEANRPCIILTEAMDSWGEITEDFELEDLKEIVEPYARELGIPEYGEVHVYGKRYEEKRNIFAVR